MRSACRLPATHRVTRFARLPCAAADSVSAQVNRLLDLIVNSLYSNKDVRPLIALSMSLVAWKAASAASHSRSHPLPPTLSSCFVVSAGVSP